MGFFKNVFRYSLGRNISEKHPHASGTAYMMLGSICDDIKKEQKSISRNNYETLKSVKRNVTNDLVVAVDRDFEHLSEVQRKVFKYKAQMIGKEIKYDNTSKIEKELDDWNMEINFVNYVDYICIQFLELIEESEETTATQKQKSREFYEKICKCVFIFDSKKQLMKFFDYMEAEEIITDLNFRNEILNQMEIIINSR